MWHSCEVVPGEGKREGHTTELSAVGPIRCTTSGCTTHLFEAGTGMEKKGFAAWANVQTARSFARMPSSRWDLPKNIFCFYFFFLHTMRRSLIDLVFVCLSRKIETELVCIMSQFLLASTRAWKEEARFPARRINTRYTCILILLHQQTSDHTARSADPSLSLV